MSHRGWATAASFNCLASLTIGAIDAAAVARIHLGAICINHGDDHNERPGGKEKRMRERE